jgi:DNA-binding MurR/RpiR family transcriptional regulator
MTDKYDTLSPSFSKVADYLISHYEDAAFMSAAEIANQADVSESVVVRFAAHIGYNGFPQLRRDMQRIVKEKLAPARRLEESDQQEGDPLFRKMVERDRENLVQILDNLSESTFRDATEAMASAKTIYVAGFRGLANLASCLGFLLGLFMPNIRVLVDADTRLFSQLRDIGKDDLLIAFYFKRYDKRTLEAIDMATDVGAQTLTITDSFVSPSAQVSDLTLVCEPESGYFFNSYVTAVAMINILVTGLVRELGLDHVKEKLDELDELLPEEDFVSI